MVAVVSAAQMAMIAAGAIQGFLLTRTWAVGLRLQKLFQGKVERGPNLKFRLLAILLAFSPSLTWIAPPADSTSPGLLGVRFVTGMLGGFFLGLFTLRPVSDDPIEATVSATGKPTIAVFGRFAAEDREMEDFLICLKDRQAKRLWKRFQTVPVDLDEQPEILAKYEVDPARGLQAMFFLKDGTRLKLDGRDRIFADDMLDPRRFECHLQAALGQWDVS